MPGSAAAAMEELAAAPPPRHRERRHRRKASDAAAAARAAYGDVFGGPPRFAAPFAGVPGDYAEVFGGVAASCSIPYLDLPPAAAACDDGGAGGYGEIFGRSDFGDFAVPYEDLFAGAEGMAEEIASSSGSSRSSIRKESGQLDAEPSMHYQHYPNVGYDQHFEEQFSPISFSPDGEQQFSMSYNKTSRGRPDDLVEMTTCVVEPSISYVVDSCNLSNDSVTNHVPLMDDGLLANGEKGKMSPPFPASSSVKSANSDSVADQKQHIPTCPPISENFYEDENYHKRSSTHSTSSEEAPSPDYPFLRVSNINLQTPPIKVQPPSMPPSKLLNKKESKVNGDSEVNPNSAAAAAIKEAMEFAEARLKAAKELMERKGDSFKLRKRPGHHRGIKSTEIKENKTPEEVHAFEEKLTLGRLAKEEKNCEDLPLLDKNRDGSAVKLPHCDHNEKEVLSPGKPQQMMQSGSKLEQLGQWASDAEFYELISHDQKCKTDTAAYEGDNGQTTNLSTKSCKFEKGKGGTAGDLEVYGKLCDGNDIMELRMKHANLREDDTASMEVEHKAPTAPEVPLCEERAVYQETTDSHFKDCVGVRNSPEGHDDDGRFEISCINGIPPKLHVVPEISSSSLETCISGDHSNGNKNCSDASTEETLLVGKCNKDNSNKEELEIPCADETLCTSVRSQILQEHPEVPNIDESEVSQVKIAKLEESAESYEQDKLFSFVGACLQNENERITEVHSEALLHEEMNKIGTKKKTGQREDFQDGDVDWDAGSSEKEANVTSESSNANENEEAEVLNVFVGDNKLMENNVRTCRTFDSDSHQLQESQLGPHDLENRMDGVEDLVSDGNEKEAKEPLLENNEKTLVEAILNHDSGRTSMETGISNGPNDVYAEVNVKNDREHTVLHSGTEVIADDSDYKMKMNTCSKDPQALFSEACAIMQPLSHNAESVSSQMPDKSTPVLENLEEDCREAEREFPTEKYAALEEGQNTRSKMEERDDKDKIASIKLKDQQSVHLGSDAIPKFAVDTASNFVQKSREEIPDVQRIEGRDNVKKTEREIEKEKEVFRRLDEEKERECKMEKEKNKERPRRELEEEKERERERAKDRLAVQRATTEAHERAFAEARAKSERIALERITLARQRASAEAREKEEKATTEAAAEKASREARIKAERAAVERATAEARERAIEKAKAAADAKERMERFRSSFKDSFKSTNQDNQQDTQFQKTASNTYGRSTDSCNQVAEVESALRHKARSERHQRTAERAAKALAEKNMRDMLAQREQAEKHRLAEFLDPEVKRWSNGKEGNLRALLSTLQYILGSDSGWQSVPLTDLITAAAVKKAYRRATLCVHPDKLQQRGATIRQKYICEKVFDLLKEAWNKFNSEER